MQAVLFKLPGQEWRWLGGMSLLERNLRLLSHVGVERVLVLHPPGDQVPPLVAPRTLTLEVVRSPLEIATADPLTVLPVLREEIDKPFFLLDVNLLVDPRVLDIMAKQTPPCFMVQGNGVYPPPWRVGVLAPRHLPLGNEILRKAQRVSLLTVPVYDPGLHGNAKPYCENMHTEGDLHRGWRLLIDRGSKRPADIVEQYLDPPIENWIVRTLCDTAVTPYHVTLLSVAFALAGASLFYQGFFFLALLFAWVAIILDGVEHKLARVKLMISSSDGLGRIADRFYENAWYLALAARLAHTGHPMAWLIGLAIVACDIGDNVLRAFFTRVKGKTLEEMSAFDQHFRLIGGRRGIYLLILLIGVLGGAPFLAFQAVLGWAAITMIIHLGRALFHVLRRDPAST